MSRDPAFKKVLYVTHTADATWFNPNIGLTDSPNYSNATQKANAVDQCETLVSHRPGGEEIGEPVKPNTLASW